MDTFTTSTKTHFNSRFISIVVETVDSDYCRRAASFLICQSSFPLCGCEGGLSYFSSRNECNTVSMDECKEEWTSAGEHGIPLPNCTDLPEEIVIEGQLCAYLNTMPMHPKLMLCDCCCMCVYK